MKKTLLIAIIGISFSGYSNEVKTKKTVKKIIKTEIDCWRVYTDTRNAALAQGFTIGPAQQIGLAAYYACNKTKSVVAE